MIGVSVIVPVYNAKEYLPICVESILSQRYDGWELLLVDNGSTDGSLELCQHYAKEHGQVRLLRQSEGGASGARNAGLEAAAGTYIVFADADDYLADAQVLGEMVRGMEEASADILVGNYQRLWKGNLLPAKGHASFRGVDRESGAFRFQGFFSVGVLSYVWCKMYRRSFLEDHAVTFGAYDYAEDKMFNFACYLHGARYAFLDRDVYVYRKNDDSISHSYRKDSVACWMRIAQNLQRLLEQENLVAEYGGLVANTIFFAVFFDGKMEYVHGKKSLAPVKKTLRKYRNHALAGRYFGEFASGRRLREIPSLAWKVMIWGFSVAMYLKWYLPLSLGIKLLVDCRVDERLSDTGLRER